MKEFNKNQYFFNKKLYKYNKKEKNDLKIKYDQ